MTHSALHPGLRARLIQQLARQSGRRPSNGSQGFTLIELLVVVIIIAILAALALPGFLEQSVKAKASSAKGMVSSALKQCQVAIVEANTAGYATNIQGTPEIAFDPATTAGDVDCVPQADPTLVVAQYTAEVLLKPIGDADNPKFTVSMTGEDLITKTCSPTTGPGCNGGSW